MPSKPLRRSCRLALLAGLLSASGCASLADRLVDPPGQRHGPSLPALPGLSSQRIATAQGNRISYVVVTPGSYAIDTAFSRQANAFNFEFNLSPLQPPAPLQTRGTVIYLHGWGADGRSMLPWAVALAEGGYRGIVVDLRHHGQSDPAPLGFGEREAQDLAELVPQWRRQGLIQGPLYLFGHSYGATTALLLAGRLADPPARGVIALAPYANAGQAVPGFIDQLLHDPATPALVRWWYDPARIQRGIAEAERRLQLDLSAVDASAAVAAARSCTVILHGGIDRWVPPTQSASLGAGNPRVQRVALPYDGHVSTLLRLDWLRQPLLDWMATTGDGQACQSLRLGADPLPPPVAHPDD